jgi:hypothetical protein
MLSKIKSIEIRACRGGDQLEELDTVAAVKLPGGSRPDFTVVTITAEDGVQGTSFGFGAQGCRCCDVTGEAIFYWS